MTKQMSSLCTSANTVINDDLDYCDIELNKKISINDVVAVKNPFCYFKIGKVNEIKENDINITLFHYKLHTKNEHIIGNDVLLNFGNIGAKTMFELRDEQQSILINRVFELDANFNSLIHLLTDIKQKELIISNMERTIEDIFVKLVVVNDYSPQLIKEFLDNQSMEFSKIIGCVMNNLEQIKNQAKIEQLAEFVGQLCFENRSLKYINDRIIYMGDNEDSSKIKFLRLVLKETGHLIGKMDVTAWENSFVVEYVRLSASAMSW